MAHLKDTGASHKTSTRCPCHDRLQDASLDDVYSSHFIEGNVASLLRYQIVDFMESVPHRLNPCLTWYVERGRLLAAILLRRDNKCLKSSLASVRVWCDV